MTALREPAVSEALAATDPLRLEVRAFVDEERAAGRFAPIADARLAGWDEDFSRRLGERGWLGMTLPAEYGGHGRSALERFAVTEELLAAAAPVAAHWIADRQIGPSLLRFGTEEQRRMYLPGIARGEVYFGIGMSEPDSGSDLASVRTKGVRTDGGWLVTGTKVWTSGAHHAHAFFAPVRTAPLDTSHRHAGLSQLIVPLDSTGVTIRPIHLLTGEHHFNEVVPDEVFVPDSMVLGEVGRGWHRVTSELAFERSGPERFLSTYPLIAVLVDALAQRADRAGRRELRAPARPPRDAARHVARCRRLALVGCRPRCPGRPGQGHRGPVSRARSWPQADSLLDVEPDLDSDDPTRRLLAQAVLHTPGFTIRGGTNEILRGVVARGMGVR
ncbi:acyl-CoA dehydrogenase family protein [Janibacter limosus]|uniref:Acyl-CoA dehydrogenase family protein n=2 Tax=Janibacter limosus TaxID=53458 RepID=A0AC61U8Q4_9MICO|nr:acyl-CoA dehydrogenase family protein [Janibacter limosus]UUZ46227.1 acyl-CoA dehydrogenase family protein [Janibacter limosus]